MVVVVVVVAAGWRLPWWSRWGCSGGAVRMADVVVLTVKPLQYSSPGSRTFRMEVSLAFGFIFPSGEPGAAESGSGVGAGPCSPGMRGEERV